MSETEDLGLILIRLNVSVATVFATSCLQTCFLQCNPF